MNRNMKFRIAMAVCAVAVIAAVLAAVGIIGSGMGYSYANAEKYSAGETEITDRVRGLDVGWADGSVSIRYHDHDTVLVRESSEKNIGEDQKLRWWLDGDTLRIRYAKPGLRLTWNLNKKLVLTLPRDIELGAVTLSAASGDLIVPDLKAETLRMSAASGDITASAAVKTLNAETASGNQTLKLLGRAESVEASAASGSIAVEANDTDRIILSAASGSISAEAEAVGTFSASASSGAVGVRIGSVREVRISTASGNVTFGAGQADKTDISTASGRVTAALSPMPGFTARLETASGRIDSTIALTKSSGTYTCGDGSAEVVIHTASGNIRIEEWQE